MTLAFNAWGWHQRAMARLCGPGHCCWLVLNRTPPLVLNSTPPCCRAAEDHAALQHILQGRTPCHGGEAGARWLTKEARRTLRVEQLATLTSLPQLQRQKLRYKGVEEGNGSERPSRCDALEEATVARTPARVVVVVRDVKRGPAHTDKRTIENHAAKEVEVRSHDIKR